MGTVTLNGQVMSVRAAVAYLRSVSATWDANTRLSYLGQDGAIHIATGATTAVGYVNIRGSRVDVLDVRNALTRNTPLPPPVDQVGDDARRKDCEDSMRELGMPESLIETTRSMSIELVGELCLWVVDYAQRYHEELSKHN